MALDSTSTHQDALDQLNDNLSWEGSPTKAALALEAVRWLLFNRPKASADDGISLDFQDLKDLEDRLQRYVDANGSTGRAARSSFVRGRAL